MRPRSEFSAKLKEVSGINNIYYQPPQSKKMVYPCIRYDTIDMQIKSADNKTYIMDRGYLVKIIGQDIDFVDTLSANLLQAFPMAIYDQSYKADDLNHTILKIYY